MAATQAVKEKMVVVDTNSADTCQIMFSECACACVSLHFQPEPDGTRSGSVFWKIDSGRAKLGFAMTELCLFILGYNLAWLCVITLSAYCALSLCSSH